MIFSSDSTKAHEQPVASHAAWITFAKEWAIGRKSRMTSSVEMTRIDSIAAAS